MAENGFESNSSFEFEIDCLLKGDCSGVRSLNVQGEPGRHKTAFANAVAQSLDYPSVMYFDFSISQAEEDKEIAREVMQLDGDKDGKFVPPVKPLDKIMTDACAWSESQPVFIILDQLQIALFADHIRLYKFIGTATWAYSGAQFTANTKNILLCLISEEPLYHSLQMHSYRIWVHRHALRNMTFTATELGLNENVQPLIHGLNQMFTELGVMPTLSEFKVLIADLLNFVRHEDQFASAIYARVSGVDRESLNSANMNAQYKRLQPLLEQAIQIEHVSC